VVVDAAMNDLARPALYDAWHDFAAVTPDGERFTANIVGPICESSDTFAMARDIDREAGRSGRVPHRRRLWRDDGQHLQLAPAGARSDGRWRPWAVVADRIDPATILAAERVPDFLKG
jgi:diaminopimelate decarboxylase